MEANDVLADEELKSRLAAVGAGILVIVAGFLVYNYFSKVGEGEQLLDEGTQTEQVAEQGEESGEEEEVMGEEAQAPSKDTEVEGTGGPEPSYFWTATNYQEGDITGEEYTVEEGDTLWEIAEARYGSGSEWTKIRDANSDQIGTLPNGSQALIVPGQTLTLP